MQSELKGNAVFRGVLTGIGITVLFLLLGTVLDYILTQILSQFFIPNCSEDCYFQWFNAIFWIVALISLAAGIGSGIRVYRRLSK